MAKNRKWVIKQDLGAIKSGNIGEWDHGEVWFDYRPPTHQDWETSKHIKFPIEFVENHPELFQEVIERWKPSAQELLFFVHSDGRVAQGSIMYHSPEVNFGNCFRGEFQAIEASRRIKQTLMAYHRELAQKGEG
jgi:hypothetical protein